VCDLNELARIANDGPDLLFRYSIPDRGDPTEHWIKTKFDPTILLVLFSTPPALQTFKDSQTGQFIEEYYIWPSAAGASPTESDWKAAEVLYPAATLQRWRQADGYIGLRTMIRPNGRWWGLVSGD
jgi:hypothetical protein